MLGREEQLFPMQPPCSACFICKRCRAEGWHKDGCSCRPCRDCGDVRVRCWRGVSAPFLLPRGLAGHRCRWQCIDLDLAGCTECGAIHRCDVAICPVSEENDSHVCIITGNCVRMKKFTRDEFMENVVIMDLPDTIGREVSLMVEPREVKEKVNWLLTSVTARQSFEQERSRMEQKHKHLMWKMLREVKLQGRLPNLCSIMTRILHATNKIRVCSSVFQDELRGVVAESCTHSIACFLNMLGQRFRDTLGTLKVSVLIIGTLYLMRMGISMHNIIMLPKMPQLQLLLPIETHLKSYFHIKCKSITEVENLIKMCLRGLSANEIVRMGFTSVETREW